MSAHQHRNGGARISTTPRGVAGSRRDARSSPIRRPSSAGLVASFLVLLLRRRRWPTAAPGRRRRRPHAPRRPGHARPELRPRWLVVEVVAGTSPLLVRLATTRTPSGEDEATSGPARPSSCSSGDVDYGETIDGRLEYTARDGAA